MVFADATTGGRVIAVQTHERIGGTGDLELDEQIASHIALALSQRHSLQQLDELDRQRWGRIQLPADRRWVA